MAQSVDKFLSGTFVLFDVAQPFKFMSGTAVGSNRWNRFGKPAKVYFLLEKASPPLPHHLEITPDVRNVYIYINI